MNNRFGFCLRNKLDLLIKEESKKYKNPIIKRETLNAILAKKPFKLEQLETIKGLSKTKIKKYGEKIITIVNNSESENNEIKENYLWLIFDLETTGLSHTNDDIIQICIKFIVWDGDKYHEEKMFTQYIHTNKKIPFVINQLTGITNENTDSAPNFLETYKTTKNLINDIIKKYKIQHVFWLAHNGLNFDFPFWFKKQSQNNIDKDKLHEYHEWYVDTLDISKNIDWNPPLKNHKLNTLHQYLLGNEIENAHRADVDVNALTSIFLNPKIQDQVYTYVYPAEHIVEKMAKSEHRHKKKETKVEPQIFKNILDLCQHNKSMIITHFLYFLDKYPPNTNTQLIMDFIKNNPAKL